MRGWSPEDSGTQLIGAMTAGDVLAALDGSTSTRSAATSGTAALRRSEMPAAEAPSADGDPAADELDREAAMVLSAMEAAAEERLPRLTPDERRLRRIGRVAFRARATLRLWADGDEGNAWTLFTRDIDPRAMGFICQDRLPLGYGGTLSFSGPGGRKEHIEVTVTRCRPCSAGWHEGSLHFNRPQTWLVEDIVKGQ